MKRNLLDAEQLGEGFDNDQAFIVKRAELTFNEKEC